MLPDCYQIATRLLLNSYQLPKSNNSKLPNTFENTVITCDLASFITCDLASLEQTVTSNPGNPVKEEIPADDSFFKRKKKLNFGGSLVQVLQRNPVEIRSVRGYPLDFDQNCSFFTFMCKHRLRLNKNSDKYKGTAMITKESIELVAKDSLRWPEGRKWKTKDKDRRFRACFGAPSNIVAALWNLIVARGNIDESGAHPKHLLWALVHLKTYSTIEIHCSIVGWPSAKTFAKWSWYFVERLSELKDDVISLDNRFDGIDGGVAYTNCFMSVDGTDCPVFEPWPFSKTMYSHKLNGPGVKYEVGVCLMTGRIVWTNGPFVGSKHDGTIFRNGLSPLLHDDEGVECDRGYGGDDKMKTPSMGFDSKQRKMKSNARAQHEAVNGRLKQFNVLTTHFRHMKPDREGMMRKHGMCFNAVAVITQMKFTLGGEKIFNEGLEYDVNYF